MSSQTITKFVDEWIDDIAADNGIPLTQAREVISRSKLEAAMIDAGFDFIAESLHNAENIIGRLGPPDA